MATAFGHEAAPHRITVREFLDMDFGDRKAELEDGVIRMMAGGSEAHARIAGNVFAFLHRELSGSGCRPYGSDLAAQTESSTIRYPDVSVYCHNTVPPDPKAKLICAPCVVIEVLSPSKARHDERVKLPEYCDVPGIQEVLLIDTDTSRVRHVRRTGPDGWADDLLPKGSDVVLGSLNIRLPNDEIFAND